MFVFKLSWLPYILIIGGIGIAAEGQPAALILTVIGGVWLYFKYKNKNSGTTTQSSTTNPISKSPVTSTTSSAAPKPISPAPQTVDIVKHTMEDQSVESAKPAKKFCRHCGAKVDMGDVYCMDCGEKL